MEKKKYCKEMITIGLPITLQAIFQASYSLVDQIMVGTLGTVNIAGSGLGAKFSSLVTFTISAIASVASILIAQYHGSHDEEGVNKSFFSCLIIGFLVMALFAIPSILIPQEIMGIYSTDIKTIQAAGSYLRIIGISFIPMTGTLIISSLFRSIEKSKYPMQASILSMFLNIGINYIFIFGKFGMPKLGLVGAALGTLISRTAELFVVVYWLLNMKIRQDFYLHCLLPRDTKFYRKIGMIILPILVNEFSWSIGENIYAAIYGRMGTDALAAITLTNPLQGMFIGMFAGVSTAAIVMVGKRLGKNDLEEAYQISKFLIKFGVVASIMIGAVLLCISGWYIELFRVEPEVKRLASYIIYALAIVIIVKVSNMILAGGVLRSGGNTKITLLIDLIGTWVFGVPLGLISAFVWKMPIHMVYLILSQEELIRFLIGFYFFRKKSWMKNITK
ncbi:MAG: MATE family efflux transporter [Lachnospiraceae bacterium]|nr:MATE family efflux transporter [Lachnospiraceae bacterium]